MEKKYKFITIKEIPNAETFGHPVYEIYNNKSGNSLGIITYYPEWKQYVFGQNPVFSKSCLKDIIDFMEQLSKPGTANEKNDAQSTS